MKKNGESENTGGETKNLKALKANRYAEVKRNGGIVRVNRQSSQHQQSKRWEEENWKKLNKILL